MMDMENDSGERLIKNFPGLGEDEEELDEDDVSEEEAHDDEDLDDEDLNEEAEEDYWEEA